MKIENYRQNIAFKSAQMNILSMADTHGNILSIPDSIKTTQMNSDDIFEKGNDKSTMNVLAISGDYFMNPHKGGFLTHPEKSNGDMQYGFLLKMIHEIKNCFEHRENNFDVNFTIGNHDLEGGDEWLFDKLAKAPMTTISSNLEYVRSPLAYRLQGTKVVPSKIYEIPDNKNPELKNHVLYLGLTIPSINYYIPGGLKQTHFYNNSKKNDVALEEADLKKTIQVIKHHVKTFKQKYPDGAVVVMAHTGNKISNMLAERIPEINLILNAHDHKEFSSLKNNTMILSHGQNNKFVRGIQLYFNDEGKLSQIKERKFETERYNKMARNDEHLQKFVRSQLKEDLVPLVKYKEDAGTPEEMILDDGIRYANNVLANFMTTALKEAAKQEYPDLDSVGVHGSIFRNGLKSHDRRTTFNNIDLMKVFDGADVDLSVVRIGSVTGEELTKLITENVTNNLKSKTRNSLIQWSDFQVNKGLIKQIYNGASNAEFIDAIKFRNPETGKFEPLDPLRSYQILLSDKYLIKDTKSIKVPAKIRDKFMPISDTYETLLKKYLKSIDYDVKINEKHREKRIIQ